MVITFKIIGSEINNWGKFLKLKNFYKKRLRDNSEKKFRHTKMGIL